MAKKKLSKLSFILLAFPICKQISYSDKYFSIAYFKGHFFQHLSYFQYWKLWSHKIFQKAKAMKDFYDAPSSLISKYKILSVFLQLIVLTWSQQVPNPLQTTYHRFWAYFGFSLQFHKGIDYSASPMVILLSPPSSQPRQHILNYVI